MSSYDDEVEMWNAIVSHEASMLTDFHEAFITKQLDYILEEAQATRGAMPEEAAVELLVDDRYERGILTLAEGQSVLDLYRGFSAPSRKAGN